MAKKNQPLNASASLNGKKNASQNTSQTFPCINSDSNRKKRRKIIQNPNAIKNTSGLATRTTKRKWKIVVCTPEMYDDRIAHLISFHHIYIFSSVPRVPHANEQFFIEIDIVMTSFRFRVPEFRRTIISQCGMCVYNILVHVFSLSLPKLKKTENCFYLLGKNSSTSSLNPTH